MNKLSFTLENYLEAVYELSEPGAGARLTDVAARLSVTKSTANAAMASLAEKGLIEQGRYRQIVLTADGMKMAMSVSEKHRAIQRFFVKVLGLDDETASADACAIEHVISAKAAKAIGDYLQSGEAATSQDAIRAAIDDKGYRMV